jgi:DNA-binding LacI/PurR family transcriptional regulator
VSNRPGDPSRPTPDDAAPPARPRRVTSRDVAERAGVSRTVVSFVLNDRPNSGIPEVTRQRVLAAAAALGYRPNRAARTLASGRTHQISVLVGETRNDAYGDLFLPALLRGIDGATQERGYRILFAYLGQSGEQDALAAVRDSASDGLLFWGPDPASAALATVVATGAPTVVVGEPAAVDCPSVDIDNEAAARVAVGHLLGHGYRDVAMITNVGLDYGSSRRRVTGYLAALAAAGLSPRPQRIVPGSLDQESGRQAMEQLLRDRPWPRAVFAASDQVAVGALGALLGAGVRVPEEVAVVGFDDVPLAASVHPRLSTVRVPATELGQVAARRLIDRIEGRPVEPWRVILPTSFVARRSCGCDEPPGGG